MPRVRQVIVIGAGLAGLACARRLTQHGIACLLLEADDAPGGRVRTDHVEGFQLDRGFQVFLTGYPEARRVLDLPALHLRFFRPGAWVRYDGRFHCLSDPLRRPQDIVRTLFNPIGSMRDKLRILQLRHDALAGRLCAKSGGAHHPTYRVLATYGFSHAMQARFFRPFLGGVFLERELNTPCWVFEMVWAAFSRGAIALPRDGMEAVARQLASGLPPRSIRVRSSVEAIDGTSVLLASGERLTADAVVVATDVAAAARFCGAPAPASPARHSLGLYFEAARSPLPGPWLLVNGDEDGPIRTLSVLSEVAPSYAPAGRALISVGVHAEAAGRVADVEPRVRAQLRVWFGGDVDAWRHLRTDHIAAALPPIDVLPMPQAPWDLRVSPGVYRCGDYMESATLDGALVSGRKAADRIIMDLHPEATV